MTLRSTVSVAGRELEISNPDKVLFGDVPVTKADMIRYYQRIAEAMLPHVTARPLVLQRFPDGVTGKGFYQKNASSHFPDWIERREIATSDGRTTNYPVIHDAAGLVYLAGQGTVVFHTLLASAEQPLRPIEVIFDLDPASPDDIDVVQDAAGELRRVLDALGLAPRVKASGSKGLHVVVEVTDPDADFELTRSFSRLVAQKVAGLGPFTLEQRKNRRHGRLFLDVLRNAPAAHAVAPYSLRALPTAPIAAPLEWDEALGARFAPQRVTITNVFRRLGQKSDPWADAPGPSCTIAEALSELDD